MRKFSVCMLLTSLILLSGCAVKIVPDAVPGGTLSADGTRLSLTKGNISITAGVVEDEIFGNQDLAVASIHLDIDNRGDSEVVFDTDCFILLDKDGRQYFALTPEKVRQILAKDTYYLLPYPYVGFYYLEDYEKSAFRDSTDTSLPYYYELNPHELFTKALPAGPVIPGAHISGLIYFQAEVEAMQPFRLQVYRKGQAKSTVPDFVFPFRVAK